METGSTDFHSRGLAPITLKGNFRLKWGIDRGEVRRGLVRWRLAVQNCKKGVHIIVTIQSISLILVTLVDPESGTIHQ